MSAKALLAVIILVDMMMIGGGVSAGLIADARQMQQNTPAVGPPLECFTYSWNLSEQVIATEVYSLNGTYHLDFTLSETLHGIPGFSMPGFGKVGQIVAGVGNTTNAQIKAVRIGDTLLLNYTAFGFSCQGPWPSQISFKDLSR